MQDTRGAGMEPGLQGGPWAGPHNVRRGWEEGARHHDLQGLLVSKILKSNKRKHSYSNIK